MHAEKTQPLPRTESRSVDTSHMGDHELVDTAMHYTRGRVAFVESINRRLYQYGSLTDRQREAIDRIIQDHATPEGGRERQSRVYRQRFPALISFFGYAAISNPRARVTIERPNFRLVIRYVSRGKNEGGLYLSNGVRANSGEADIYYGKITRTGEFHPSAHCTDAVVNMILEFEESPKNAAFRYGKRTNRCCFCDQQLTDERSVAAGYGQVCAMHYGLPWGN